MSTIKTTAQNTGRRIDLSGVEQKKTTLRRKPEGEKQEQKLKAAKPEAQPKVADEPKVKADKIEEVEQPIEQPSTIENKHIASVEPQRIPISFVEPMEFDESGDFAAMLEQSETVATKVNLNVGDKVSGQIVHIGQDNAFVALGAKIEAALSSHELKDEEGKLQVHMGDRVTAYVISTSGSNILLSISPGQAALGAELLKDAQEKGMPVEGKITGQNKGGFDVEISGKRAFCPVGQIDVRFVDDPSVFVGKSFPFLITRIEEDGRNIVVSRRALLERERKAQAKELLKNISVGKVYDAVITRVADFGAFADIGGLEGLIPRSEISHGRIDRVSDALSSNDRVSVMVLSMDVDEQDPNKSRLSLSLKKTKEDPFVVHWPKVTEGAVLEGRVVRIENFGAFVELFPGIDGLIHISELSENRISHPKEILSVGDPVSVRVVKVDQESHRIGLSLREPVSKRTHAAQTTTARPERGQKAVGTISRIERYGVFVELDSGATALLPESETGLPRHSDLGRHFKIGDKLELAIIDVDTQNRVRVSLLARKSMEEQDRFLEFQNKEGERSKGFGTFADLLRKR